MTKLRGIVAEIIAELTKRQNSAAPLVDPEDGPALPRLIGTGDGRCIVVTAKIDRLIGTVAHRLQQNNPALATRFANEELNASVRSAFGPALMKIDLDDDVGQNAESVLNAVRSMIEKQVTSVGACEHAFGCTLFGNTDIPSFQIGPVRFEAREAWLDRKVAEYCVTKITARRVRRAWPGGRRSKRKPSIDSIQEDNILDAIGHCPYVCSVFTDGFASEAGKERALVAARLAMTSIALLWETPSRALDGFNLNFDRTPHRQMSLSFVPGKITLAGRKRSHMPHGPTVKQEVWKELFADHATHFSIVADVLHYFLSPNGQVARPRLMNALAQALLSFHEACREPVKLFAIAKFAASMEALAKGGKAQGIQRLITARLGIKDETMIVPALDLTMKQVVEQIYKDARSRTLHGVNDQLGFDWSVTRGRSESLARLCLLSCIHWAAENPSIDDPSRLSL